jgi:serine protease Do
MRDRSHLQFDFNQVAQSVNPVVANITTMKTIRTGSPPGLPGTINPAPNSLRRQLFFAKPFTPNANTAKKIGSGIIIDSRGYILTNSHVIAQAQDIHVTLHRLNPAVPEHFYEAQVVKQDTNTDLAIIKILPEHPLSVAKLGNSDTVKLGDWVLAIGSPFGLEDTISAGIISTTKRSLFIEGRMYRNLFQTDAAINYGNSGGPLVNMNGEVIGINTAIYSPDNTFSGIGFAIPINQVKKLITPDFTGQAAFNSPCYTQVTPEMILVAGQKATAGYLGVTLIPRFCQTARQYGLMVTGISNDSPAQRGGVVIGDVIIGINGKKITDIADFDSTMDRTRPGNKIRLLVIRQRKKKILYIRLGQIGLPGQVGLPGRKP